MSEEISVPKGKVGRPKKPMSVPEPEEEVLSDCSEGANIDVGSEEPQESPEETPPPKKKAKAPAPSGKEKKVASEKQLENLAKARMKRLEEIKKYGKAQKEAAQKEMEDFFEKKIQGEVETRLKAELKKITKASAPAPVAKPKVPKVAPAKKPAAPRKKVASAKKPSMHVFQQQYSDPYADFL